MPRLSNILPLPGICDLETLAQDFIGRLKDADVEHNRRDALARRLKCLTENARSLQSRGQLTSQLLELQQRFNAAETTGSRLDIRGAQRKLALWDELSARLDQTMEVSMLTEIAELQRSLSQISNKLERRVKVVESYDITNQVAIGDRAFAKYALDYFTHPSQTIRTCVRAGRFGKLNVTYVTYAGNSADAAHELVEKQIQDFSQMLHVNVAQLVGVTQGYYGFNGIIFVMDGMSWAAFDCTSHSGAVWAKCIRGLEDFRKSYPHLEVVGQVTITRDGHLTVFPWCPNSSVLARFEIPIYDHLDDGVAMLYKIYKSNSSIVDPAHLSAFVDSIAELRLGFTRARVMKLASSCRLFPQQESYYSGNYVHKLSPSSKAGAFAQLRYNNGEIEEWKSLGSSHHFPGSKINQDACPDPSACCGSPPAIRDHWITYGLHKEFEQDLSKAPLNYWKYSEQIRHVHWEDVLTGARQLSERLDIDLESIAFCHSIEISVHLRESPRVHRDEVPTTLYYHMSPHSSDHREAKGFLSARNTPDSGAWEDLLRQQGWNFYLSWEIKYYKMSDDWGLRYDREIQESLAAMPGSYPGAHIEEVF